MANRLTRLARRMRGRGSTEEEIEEAKLAARKRQGFGSMSPERLQEVTAKGGRNSRPGFKAPLKEHEVAK